MSGMDLITVVGSGVVVVLLVVVAWLMGFRKIAGLDGDTLARELAASEPRARIADAVFDAGGRAAIAQLADGKLLAARAIADGVALRTVPAESARVRLRGAKASVVFADVGYPPLSLKLAQEAPAWLKALAK